MSKRYGILVDMGGCLGCGVCVIAYKQENDLPPYINDKPGTTGLAWNQVLRIMEGVYPELSANYLYVHRMHCGNPPCVPACPKNAISKAPKAAGDKAFVLKPEKKANPSVRYIRLQGFSLNKVSRIDEAKRLYGFEKRE